MALKTITGKVQGPDGANKTATITATLNAPTMITGTTEFVPSLVRTIAAADGTYTLSLQANNDMTPSGTYYTVSESTPDGGFSEFTIVVPQTAGPFVMSNIAGAVPALSPGPGHVASLLVDGSAAFWGHAAVGSQPAAPVTLADVIAIIRGCGLSA